MNLNLSLTGGNILQDQLLIERAKLLVGKFEGHYFSLYKQLCKLGDFSEDEFSTLLYEIDIPEKEVDRLRSLDNAVRLMDGVSSDEKKGLAKEIRIGCGDVVSVGGSNLRYLDALEALAYIGYIDRNEAVGLMARKVLP